MNEPTTRTVPGRESGAAAQVLLLILIPLTLGLLCLAWVLSKDASEAARTQAAGAPVQPGAARPEEPRADQSAAPPSSSVVQTPARQFDFFLVHGSRLGQARWNLSGPYREDGPALCYHNLRPSALSSDRTRLYTLADNRVRAYDLLDDTPDRPLPLADLPSDFPPFSWPSGLAYDSARDRVIVISQGGEGFWYRYDARAKRWLDHRSLHGRDLVSLTFDAKTDRFVALDNRLPGRLVFLSPEGDILSEKDIKGDVRRAVEPPGPWTAAPALFADGDDVALVEFANPVPRRYFFGQRVTSIRHYDTAAEQATLTYTARPLTDAEIRASGLDQTCGHIPIAPPSPRFAPPSGRPVRAPEPGESRDMLALSAEAPPKELAKELAKGAELIVMSGYSMYSASEQGAESRVVVRRPGKKVILVLSSHTALRWRVEAGPRTELAAILVGSAGNNRSEVLTRARTKGFFLGPALPSVTEAESRRFVDMLALLNRLFGVDRVDALRCALDIPREIVVDAPDPPRPELTLAGPQAQAAGTDLSFQLTTPDHRRVDWTTGGPADEADTAGLYLEEKPLALSPDGHLLFTVAEGRLRILDLTDGTESAPDLPPNFPRFSHPGGLAYDSKRDLVSVAASRGLYRYDVQAGRWLDYRSLNYSDVSSLAYDESRDRYAAAFGRGDILYISGDIEPLFRREVRSRMAGFDRLRYGDWGLPRETALFPQEDALILAYFVGGRVRALWHYDLIADQVTLTWQNQAITEEKRPWARP